ncbi:MAG TPA: trehalose-phosphatase [Micromonosporaceae bacterium]|nr:trehalose-phosphatase [Micromonosporaceae bacterium]
MSFTPTAGIRPGDLDPELRQAVARIARVPHLLVACDYDGTIAPLVDEPTHAVPLPEAVAAIRTLAVLPQTVVAVISGRSLRDLAAISRLPSEVRLVGSHGSEFDVGFVERISPEVADLRTRIGQEISAITRGRPGIRLEQKPASVAVHTRAAPREVADEVMEALRSGPATWPGVFTTVVRDVIELSVVATDKGQAVDELRIQNAASAVIFLGDDATDENAFALLQGPDLGIKVGAADETQATYTVPDPDTAVRVLEWLAESRRRWLYGERAVPIERHTLLSNGRSLALITPAGKVAWLCHPRPDSPATFAALLGDDSAGYFSVAPARGGRMGEPMPLGQRYRHGTMTVQTRWSGLTVTDSLQGEEPQSTLVRVLTGHIPVRLSFAPRSEFGQVPTRLKREGNELRVFGSNDPMRLVGPNIDWEIVEDGAHHTAHATVDLAAHGGTVALELHLGADEEPGPPAPPPDPAEVIARQAENENEWREWSQRLRLPTRARDLVLRSALTLRALCYRPTGAIIAAGTSSLPEEMGGVRNWDYRYCWLRDAAMSAQALVKLGSGAEAEALLAWTRRVIESTAGHPERLHPLYSVDGFELGAEAVIETLPGYSGSRPVRVGNAANRQVQLDVFGPIADLIAHYADLRGSLDEWHLELMENMVAAVSRRWHEPDHGIWEARIPPRHHVYSKVMGWLTVDRALRVSERYGGTVDPEWVALREKIAEEVLNRGWHPEVGAFTVAYGDPEMDASSLWIGLSGLLPDDDPRFLATVLAIEAELRSGPIVYRYRWDDGLPGQEGGFHLCSAWLIEAYLRTGRRADAEELFEQMVSCAGPTGLLPEEYDPLTERGLGNHPQAYSHLGLINCALLLDT